MCTVRCCLLPVWPWTADQVAIPCQLRGGLCDVSSSSRSLPTGITANKQANKQANTQKANELRQQIDLGWARAICSGAGSISWRTPTRAAYCLFWLTLEAVPLQLGTFDTLSEGNTIQQTWKLRNNPVVHWHSGVKVECNHYKLL